MSMIGLKLSNRKGYHNAQTKKKRTFAPQLEIYMRRVPWRTIRDFLGRWGAHLAGIFLHTAYSCCWCTQKRRGFREEVVWVLDEVITNVTPTCTSCEDVTQPR